MSQGEVINPETDDRVKYPERYKGEAELQNLEDLFIHLLQDMYYAEGKITKALPKMIKNTTNPDLKAGFEKHLEETKEQIKMLEEVFESLGYEKEKEKCEAIEGLLEEGDGLIDEAAHGATRDSALIAAAQKVEHYEIASYGTLCNMAKMLGFVEESHILHEILDQEKATDKRLSKICDKIEKDSMKQAA